MNSLRVPRLFTGLPPLLAAVPKLLAFGAFAIWLAPQAVWAQSQQCPLGNATMNGLYVSSATGTRVDVGPIASVTLVIYNGDGTGRVVINTSSVNGAASTATGIPATFTVNSDCSGTKTIGTSNFNFVITPDGSTITWIRTDTGVTLMGIAHRLRR